MKQKTLWLLTLCMGVMFVHCSKDPKPEPEPEPAAEVINLL